jgi:hypothetical protein
MKMAYGLIIRFENNGNSISDLLSKNSNEINEVNNMNNNEHSSSKLIPSEAVHTLVKCVIDAITLEPSSNLTSSKSLSSLP